MKPTLLGARKSTRAGKYRGSYDAASCASAHQGGAGGDSGDADILEFLLWVQFDYCGTSAADAGGVELASVAANPFSTYVCRTTKE